MVLFGRYGGKTLDDCVERVGQECGEEVWEKPDESKYAWVDTWKGRRGCFDAECYSGGVIPALILNKSCSGACAYCWKYIIYYHLTRFFIREIYYHLPLNSV